MKCISVCHWNNKGMTPEGVLLLDWMKKFNLLISIDGRFYIDPSSRCFIRDNQLKSLLRRDVNASMSVIESFVSGMKNATKMMINDGTKWHYLIQEINPTGEYMK